MKSKFKFADFVIIIAVTAAIFGAPGCTDDWDRKFKRYQKDPFDWNANLSRSEISEALRPQKPELDRDKQADDQFSGHHIEATSAPPLAPIVLAPDAPDIKSTKRVSLAITEKIPLKDVFLELARLAEIELALDPNIKGGIILSVSNRPVKEVIDMVCNMSGLRYSVDGNVLKVELDTPYLVNYDVDFLNLIRSSTGSLSTNVQTGNGGANGGGGGGGGGANSGGGNAGSNSGGTSNSGSKNEISSQIDGNLWEALSENLGAILDIKLANLKSEEAGDARAGGVDVQEQRNQPKAKVGEENELMAKIKEVQTKPIEQPSIATSKTATLSSHFTLNKQAGIISVVTTKSKHKSVREYLSKLKNSLSQQVLIEAKVVEVQLFDEFAGGIDWGAVGINLGGDHHVNLNMNTDVDISKIFDNKYAIPGLAVGASKLVFKGSNPSGILHALEGFGITRTLSNPRITVSNNQQAILTFATNQSYYTVTGTPAATNVSTTAGTTQTSVQLPTITSTLHTVPIGVILSLQPSVDPETKEITMHVRPTLTDASSGINDPAVDIIKLSILANLNTTNQNVQDQVTSAIGKLSSIVPTVRTREIDTILKAKSGDVMVIGGLIQHNDASSEAGFPILSEIPFIGRAAKQTAHKSSVIETVILIQATIIPTSYYHSHDKRLYDTFTQDPRPLVFN